MIGDGMVGARHMNMIKLTLLTLLAAACGDSESKLTTNVAIDTVHYVLPGAQCEEAFRERGMHSARCTLQDGTKVYCVAGGGWNCAALYDARQVAVPPTAPAAPAIAPPAQGSAAPQAPQPKK